MGAFLSTLHIYLVGRIIWWNALCGKMHTSNAVLIAIYKPHYNYLWVPFDHLRQRLFILFSREWFITCHTDFMLNSPVFTRVLDLRSTIRSVGRLPVLMSGRCWHMEMHSISESTKTAHWIESLPFMHKIHIFTNLIFIALLFIFVLFLF